MFREMRRKKQILSREKSIEILNNNTSGVLALHGDDDYPYALPISYAYDDNKIYFHSAKTGHKIDAIKRNNKASFCVIDKDMVVGEEFTTYFRSIIAFGKIRFIKDEKAIIDALIKLSNKYSPNESDEKRDKEIKMSLTNLEMFYLDIEHLSGKEAIELVQKNI